MTKEISMRRAAMIAGFTYMAIIVIGILNGIFIDTKLIVPGDNTATANNILANEGLFRAGIAAMLVLYTMVIVLAWALYLILKSIGRQFALLALLLRSAEAVVGIATVMLSFFALDLLNGAQYSNEFDSGQLAGLAAVCLNVRIAGMDLVLVLVGFGGLVFCYLFYISRYIPRILAAWGMLTYVSMVILGLISILYPNHPVMLENILYGAGASFEITIGLWLMIKGVKLNGTPSPNPSQWEGNCP